MPRSIRGLAGRLKNRLRPRHVVGERYLPEYAGPLEDFTGIAHQASQLMGAGLVQSWEIAVAEIGRVLRLQLSPEEAEPLIERWSDALVPTEQPVQTLTRRVERILERGHKRAQQSGVLGDVFGELCGDLDALGGKVAEGWAGTVGHLGPIFERGAGVDLEARGAELGATMQRELEAAAAEFRGALAAMKDAPDLQRALFEALDAYQSSAIRSFEVNIYALKADTIRALQR